MTPKWYQIATAELGEQEIRGKEDNPRIVAYQQATGLKAEDDETPWCGAFVAWCLRESGIHYNKERAASARSWLSFGRKLKNPTIGCIVVFWRGKPNGWQGHVGFYAGRDSQGRILVLGGNQDDEVSIKPHSADRLLGYRWPSDVPLPPDIQPLHQSGVVQGTMVAIASGAAVVADNLPSITSQLERADGHIQTGTVLGAIIGALIIAGSGWALWKRISAARQLRETSGSAS